MSFAQSYQPFLFVLIAFGLFPIIYNTRTKQFESSKICSTYAIIFNIFLISFIIILFGFRIANSLNELNQIYVLVNLVQSMVCQVMQVSMIASCLWTSGAHVRFLNDILQLDRKINLILRRKAINDHSFMHRHVLETISFFTAYLLLMIYLDRSIHHLEQYWYNIAWKKTLYERVSIQLMAILHIRFCALLLTRRLRLVILELEHVNAMKSRQYSAFITELFNDLCELKDRFEPIFGSAILMNSVQDLLTGIVVVYMTIVNILDQHDPRLFGFTILIFAEIILKQAMYSSAVNELNNQAQKLRIVKRWHTNYLQVSL